MFIPVLYENAQGSLELYSVSLNCVCGQLQTRCVDTTPIVMHPAMLEPLCVFHTHLLHAAHT